MKYIYPIISCLAVLLASCSGPLSEVTMDRGTEPKGRVASGGSVQTGVGSNRQSANRGGNGAIESTSPNRMAKQQRPFVEDRSNLDFTNPGVALLQSPREAMGEFPVDRFGGIDWVEALRGKNITPRASVSGAADMAVKTEGVVMPNTRSMPFVMFPHQQHTQWLDCTNCHPVPFEKRAGGHSITMNSIMRGEDCGLCHGKVAFSIMECERCHNVTHSGSPKRWW